MVEAETKKVSTMYIQKVNITPAIVPFGMALLGLFNSPVKEKMFPGTINLISCLEKITDLLKPFSQNCMYMYL